MTRVLRLLAPGVLAAGLLAASQGTPVHSTTPALAAGCPLVQSPAANIAPASTGFSTPANVVATFDAARQAEGCSVPLSIDQTTFASLSPQGQMLALFNAERRDRGLGTLTLDSTLLSQIDLNHSREMAQYSYFNHPSPINHPGPTHVFDRDTVNPAIAGHWTGLGENIAAGYSTAAQAVYVYMYQDSAEGWGHRHNILGSFTWVGIGVATGGPYSIYYSSDFLNGSYTPPAAADTQAPGLSAPAVVSGSPASGGTVTVQVTGVQDTGASAGEAGVTGVVFYANAVTQDSSGNANTVSATSVGSGVWQATLSVPAGAVLHAVAVDGSGNYTDCSASSSTCPGASTGGGSGSSTTIRVGVTGTDGTAQSWQLNGGFSALGATLLAAPAVGILRNPVSGQPPVAYDVGLASDHNLWIRSDSQGWQRLAPIGTYCLDSPGLLLTGTVGNAAITVACHGSDGAVWTASGTFGSSLPQLSNWTSLGATIQSGPAVGTVAGVTTYYVLGMDNALWTRTATTNWTQTAWRCTGHPALASSGSTSYLACDGTDGALWYATNTGRGWSVPRSAGGTILDGPGIAATSSGATFFVEGSDNALWQITLSTSGVLGSFKSDGGSIQYGVMAAGL